MHDVIVVGSGAGGAAAAYHLAQSGADVLLLERGNVLPRDGSTLDSGNVLRRRLFAAGEAWFDARGRRLHPAEFANLGGKTAWYGAALPRFAPHEFGADPDYQCPAWPLSYADLAPFYDAAEQLLQVRRFAAEAELLGIVMGLQEHDAGWRKSALPLGLAADILAFPEEARRSEGFASARGLKAEAAGALLQRVGDGANLSVRTGAEVVELTPAAGDGRRVAGVLCADGSAHWAGHVVLAAGALHSPRLLQRYLAARAPLVPPGADLVGRFYKGHLCSVVLALSGTRMRDVLRRTVLLTHAAFPHSTVRSTGWLDAEQLAAHKLRWLPRPLRSAAAARVYGFRITTEDGSHPDNRVLAMSPGGAGPRLDYRPARSAAALAEHRRLRALMCRQLPALGYLPWVAMLPAAATADACGTLMAGRDPAQSVVDRDGRAHGFANLYVADGSALTRSGRVDPALTIYAWGLRVASRLALNA